ncbi:MAG: Glutamyl-tRNA reductase [Chlamydiae bacterium]|nr:Glutamyl-tRNA reductase [Chlamydiota bacterium]
MNVGLIGINHKIADLGFRERFAKVCHALFGTAHTRLQVVLLSTCNRTELYFSSSDLAKTHSIILNLLKDHLSEEFDSLLYTYFGIDCFYHLARVTAGLDSAIIGETEIQGQVKSAYEAAAAQHRLPHALHFLFQKSLKIGKKVRSSFPALTERGSLDETILEKAGDLLGDLKTKKVLFVGASKINKKILARFKQRGVTQISLCNRSTLSQLPSERVLPWQQLSRWIEYDLTIFGTKSLDYLIFPSTFSPRTRVVIDLGVPRNVDPRLGRLSQISLFNIDQLNHLVAYKQKFEKSDPLYLASQIVAEGARNHLSLFQAKERYRPQILLAQAS